MSHKAKFIFFKGGLDICGEFSAGQTIAEIKQFLLHEHISAFKPESQDIVLVHVESESKLMDDAQRVSTLGTPFSILVNVVKKLQRVVFFSHDGTEIFNRPFPLTATVLDLKRTIDASNHISMDLLTKNRETKEWTEQLCSDNCELSSIQHHSRPDGALHIRIRVREVWRLQAFIGLFADPFVSKLDLEGGFLMRTMKETRIMLNAVLGSAAMPSFLRSDICKSAIFSVISHLQSAEKWEVMLNQPRSSTVVQCTHFMEEFRKDVTALEVGRIMVWGGGWSGVPVGHGVMHVLQRDSTDTFTFTTCNTGEGLAFHNARAAKCFPKETCNLFLAVPNIPRSRIVDDFSWAHVLWGLRFEALDSNCAQVLYEVVLPHLNGGPVRDCSDVPKMAGKSAELPEDTGKRADGGPSDDVPSQFSSESTFPETFGFDFQDELDAADDGYGSQQRSGTCAARSVLALVKFLLKRSGMNRRERKLVSYGMRLAYVERIEASLQRILSRDTPSSHTDSRFEPQILNQSDVTLITFALSQTSRAALKLVKRKKPVLLENDMYVLDNQITRIRRLLDRVKTHQTGTFLEPRALLGLVTASERRDEHSQETELVFESTECAHLPFVNFDFVASSGSCEALAGAYLPISSSVLLDYNAATSSSWQRETAHTAAASHAILRSNIFELRHVTDVLRKNGDNVASLKIVAIVEHAFTCNFPIPISRLHTTCPWSFEHSSRRDQLELLQAILAIAKTFLDASLRILPSHYRGDDDPFSNRAMDYDQAVDDLDGPRSITFACILAVFDAVMSSKSTDASQLPLSVAFDVFHFFPAVEDFSGCPFAVLTAHFTVTRPELVLARDLVSSYFAQMREQQYHGREFGRWEMNHNGGFLVKAHEGEMALFDIICQIEQRLNQDQSNKQFTSWLCDIGSVKWDDAQLNDLIPEVNLYFMVLLYFKVAMSPWKLIRSFVFHEHSSGINFRYTNESQIEPNLKKDAIVDPEGHMYIQFKGTGGHSGDFPDMIHNAKGGLISLHAAQERETTAPFQPNDDHVKSTDVFKAIKELIHPEADAVHAASLFLVPEMAIPYLLDFFSKQRINVLQSDILQKKLWNVLFRPHVYQKHCAGIGEVPVSGHDRPLYFGTSRGLLMYELEHSPAAVLQPMTDLLAHICDLAEDATTGRSQRRLLLFLLRCSCIIELFAASAQDRAAPSIQSVLLKHRTDLQLAQRRCIPILEGWILYVASTTGSQERLNDVELHSSLSILHSIPLFDNRFPSVDFGAFYFSACSVMTMMQPQDSAVCPILDVLHSIHRLRLDVTKLTEENEDHRDRILRRMWFSQKRGELPVPQEFTSLWRHAEFDMGVFVEQRITLTFGKNASPETSKIDVCFPGVSRLAIYFEAAETVEAADVDSFFTIFRSKHEGKEKELGERFYQGSKERWLQGDFMSHNHSREGFILADVVSDSIEIVKFSRGSAGSVPPWNIRLRARAAVNFACARSVAQTVFAGQHIDLVRVNAAAVALGRTGHNISQAIDYLLDETKRKELLAIAKEKLPSTGNRVFNSDYKAHFEDYATGKIYFNIQSAEVVFQDSAEVLPEEISLHKDFSSIMGSKSPQCNVLQPETNRRRFSVIDVCSNIKYLLSSWNPQTPEEFNASLRRAKIIDTNESDDVPDIPGLTKQHSGIVGMPFRCDDGQRLSFCDLFFEPYEAQSRGWFSILLDDAVSSFSSLHSMVKPLIWICESPKAEIESDLEMEDYRAIILAESSLNTREARQECCAFDDNGDLVRQPQMTRGFYEVIGNSKWKFIQCFALRERGRAITREIVYTSDARLCLAHFSESSRPLKEPFKQGREHAAGDMFSGMPISKGDSDFTGSSGAGNEEWIDIGAHSTETLVISRTRQAPRDFVETLVPSSSLKGLVPEILIENFIFWMQGGTDVAAHDAIIRGELRRDADAHFTSWGSDCTVEICFIKSEGNGLAQARIWRQRTNRHSEKDDHCDESAEIYEEKMSSDIEMQHRAPTKEALINAQQCSKTSTLGRVIEELAHVDNLSHILVWGEDCEGTGDSTVQLFKIEMPRAGIFLRFQADDNISRILGDTSSGHQEQTTVVRVYSEDDDAFLGKSSIASDTIAQFLHAIPHGAVFCNRSQQRFVVAPLWQPRPLKVAYCPFEGLSRMRKPSRGDSHQSVLKRKITKFQQHIGGTFLQSPDMFSSMYLTLLHLVKLDYLSAGRIVRSCVVDGRLSDEISWVLRLIGRTQLEPAGDFNPDAVALRLRIALQCCDGQMQECPWDVLIDYDAYLTKMSHVSPQCILTQIEELIILRQLISGSHKKHNKGGNVRDCSTTSLKHDSRLRQLSSLEPTVHVSVTNQQIGGVRWANFLAKYVREFLAEKKCGRPSQNFKSLHPAGEHFDAWQATSLLTTIRREAKGGNFSAFGFYPLYEILAGYVQCNAVGVTDGHSLAAMMLQVVWITATKRSGVTLPKEDMLCVFVLAMMCARGFNHHMLSTQGHCGLLRKFPGYDEKNKGRIAVLGNEGIPAVHQGPTPKMYPTFSERLAGAACAVMTNKRRSEDTRFFAGSPRGDLESHGQQENVFKGDHEHQRNGMRELMMADKAPTVDEGLQEDEIFGAAPKFWSDHLKALGYGTPTSKESCSVAVGCTFRQLAGATNCGQNTMCIPLFSESKVSAELNEIRTFISVRDENREENEHDLDLDERAVHDLHDVIESVPACFRLPSDKEISTTIPALSCVFDDFDGNVLVQRIELSETMVDIPFPERFSHGAAKEFESQARSKMSKDLKDSLSSFKFQFVDIGPDFLEAMNFKSDPNSMMHSSKMFREFTSKLHKLHASLEKHRKLTHSRVQRGVSAINRLLYSFDDSGFRDGSYAMSVLTERLMVTASLRPKFKFDDVIAICLSTNSVQDLRSCNSTLTPQICAHLIHCAAAVMLHAVRLGHILRCLNSTVRLIDDFVVFACEQICSMHPKSKLKLVDVKNILILNDFYPHLVHSILTDEAPTPTSRKSSDDNQSSVEESLCSQFEPQTPQTPKTPNSTACRWSLRGIQMRQTSVQRTQHSHIQAILMNFENSAAHLAALLAEGRDYSCSFLRRARCLVSDQHVGDDEPQLGSFDPRFLVVEFIKEIVLRQRQVELCETLRFRMQGFDRPRCAVHQMIMGAGKTHVVTPLLALLLADSKSLVTVVVPRSLLELSRSKLRETFSSVLPRFVFTLNFERLPQLYCDVNRLSENGLSEYTAAANLGNKLDRIRVLSGICITTPDAVKSLELTFIDMLYSRDRVKSDPFGPGAEKLLKMKDVVLSLHDVMSLWRRNGIAIFDEVDMILHPLRSELNFPVGTETHHDLANTDDSAARWELPMFLFEVLLQAGLDASSQTHVAAATLQSVFPFLSKFPDYIECLQGIIDGLRDGARDRDIRRGTSNIVGEHQSGEHFAILNPSFYETVLRVNLSKFALEWAIYKLHAFQSGQVHGVSLEVDQKPLDSFRTIVHKFIKGSEILSDFEKDELRKLGPTSVMLLTLVKQWITVYLAHCCSLLNRVHYGLLQTQDIKRLQRQGVDMNRIPESRLRHAVPFVGKDSPSRASEFAQPDISAGLTILAFRYEGLRSTDLHGVIQTFQNMLRFELGPMSQRKHYVCFTNWLNESNHPLREKVPTLDKLQLNEPKHMDLLMQVLSHCPGVIRYHTEQTLKKLKNASLQLQASGADLGGDIMFHGRVGFSGTPSDLLPHGMGRCMYEPGSEAAIIRVLSSKLCIGKTIQLREWNVDDLLYRVATHEPPLRALIDVGALVTGMSNEQVASKLLDFDAQNKNPRFEACVFLNEDDIEMVKVRKGGETTRLSFSPYKDRPELRFTFYDQVHTTGIDIKQSPDAHAAVTIGKDLTIRDFAQGCYRMRQLGRGQVVHCVWVPEVIKLVTRTGQDENHLPVDALAWLTSRYVESEVLQFSELCRQNADSFPRQHALAHLLNTAPDECSKMKDAATKLQQLSRSSLSSDGNVHFDPDKKGHAALLHVDTGVVEFEGQSSILCTGEFKSGIHRLSFRNLGKSGWDKAGSPCSWGIARKLEFIDCDTHLGDQYNCIGMLGIGAIFVNARHVLSRSRPLPLVQVNAVVTVIADCNRREVRWEIDGEPHPYKVSFEQAHFPKLATFNFAAGGISGRTQIVNERVEVLNLMNEVPYIQLLPYIQKLKLFLHQAIAEIQSTGADRDFHFACDFDSADRMAQLCLTFIHSCGFEKVSAHPQIEINIEMSDDKMPHTGPHVSYYHASAEGLRYSLLKGFNLALLEDGLSSLDSLLNPEEDSMPIKKHHFPDELLGNTDSPFLDFFVHDRVGGIPDDPNGPPQLAEVIIHDWNSRSSGIFGSEDMKQHEDECCKQVYGIVEQLRVLEFGESVASKSDLSTEMVNEKETELEVQAVKEALHIRPALVNAAQLWALRDLGSQNVERLPFFPASKLSFDGIQLPFPECVSISKNFCLPDPKESMPAVNFALNWHDGTCFRTCIISLAEAVTVRRAAQIQLDQASSLDTLEFEVVKICQGCKSGSFSDEPDSWKRRLSCCRFIQGDIWMSWPDDKFLLQAWESTEIPLCDSVPPERREHWFSQCLLAQKQEANLSCISDRTAPLCICIFAHSSADHIEQQRILNKCRLQLHSRNIFSGQQLLDNLNSLDAAGLQNFFELSPDEVRVLSPRLSLNKTSGIISLQVLNIFFGQQAEAIGGVSDSAFSHDDDEQLEDNSLVFYQRMPSDHPILKKNVTAVSAFNSSAATGGKALERLPECDMTSGTDALGSFHEDIKQCITNVSEKQWSLDSFAKERGHYGQWREITETKVCCAAKDEDRHEGGPLCDHFLKTKGFVQVSHWSCCGSTSRDSTCFFDMSSLPVISFPVNECLQSSEPPLKIALHKKCMEKLNQFNLLQNRRLQLTKTDFNALEKFLQHNSLDDAFNDAVAKGLQWPHENAFPILDILRCAAKSPGASVMLVRKQQIGEKWINFLQAVVNVVASARDGACHDMSRLKGLQCCNNLLFFRELQVQVSCEAESVINAFKSSATSDNALIVTEWSLLLKNISVVLLKHRVSETDEKNVLTCANASLDILRSAADPSGNDASLSVWNAIAAVATCSYYSPALRASIASARAEETLVRIVDFKRDGNTEAATAEEKRKRHQQVATLAKEALKLFC